MNPKMADVVSEAVDISIKQLHLIRPDLVGKDSVTLARMVAAAAAGHVANEWERADAETAKPKPKAEGTQKSPFEGPNLDNLFTTLRSGLAMAEAALKKQ